MKARVMWLAPVIVAAGFAQTESTITREGSYWVQTSTGAAALERAARLRVSTRGEVAIQGEARGEVAYWLKKQVKGRSESSAREELSAMGLRTIRQGDWMVMTLTPERGEAFAELRLNVPRSLREVVVVSRAGAIEAQDLDGAVKAETSAGEVQMDRIQGDLTVWTGGGNIRLGKIGGVARCSSGGGSITAESLGREAEFSTRGGEIYVREATGPVRVTTLGGNIQVGRTVSLVAATGAGLIEVGQTDGPVTAETGDGSIKVRSAKGVRCSSASGAIQLYSVSGGLRVSTAMGSILAELARAQPLEDSTLSTASGDITVSIPSNLAVTVQAIISGVGFARIVSDFPEIQARQERSRAEARGALNGGGPILRLAATEGTIYLRRQK